MNNVIEMPDPLIIYEVVMEPRSFEEMPQAIQALREHKSVVLNLTMMDPDQAQRAVILLRVVPTLDGHQERIGEVSSVYAHLCPSHYSAGRCYEVPQTPVRTQRITAPTPAPESTRIAQSS